MKSERENRLERHLGLFSTPPQREMDLSEERILHRLHSVPAIAGGEQEPPVLSGWNCKQWNRIAFAFALASAIVALLTLPTFMHGSDVYAVVESADGQLLHAGERIDSGRTVHTNNGGATLVLPDGSRVEVSGQSELVLERADDGVRIRLNEGDVLVNAAPQHANRLYVQTPDVAVYVTGTVFLVKKEQQGSRVAAIQGEVQVQQGAELSQLHPGEQIATATSMGMVPVSQELSWSRNAEAQLVLLRQSIAPVTDAPPSRPAFEVASIRPAPQLDGADSDKPQIVVPSHRYFRYGPQGIDAAGYSLRALIVEAYQFQPYQGGSSRILSTDTRMDDLLNRTFDVMANAEHPASKEELRLMLQSMLADRFKLSVHREFKLDSVYRLVDGKPGAKLERSATDTENPHWIREGGNLVFKDSSVAKFCALLSEYMDRPVLDSTGLPGLYNFPYLEGAGRTEDGQFTILSAVQKLGLRLVKEKAPLEYLVVDHVERPSEN